MIDKSTDKILFVDDEENILSMFRRTLGREYDLYTCKSAAEALALIEDHSDFAVIVSDYSMPSINGMDFLMQSRHLTPDTVFIMLTGNMELDIAIKTINEINIFRYLPKPFPTDELRKVIIAAISQYHLIIDKRALSIALERKNFELAANNVKLAQQKELLEYELEMAKTVYKKIFAYGHSEPDGLDYINISKEETGGDFLLTHTNNNELTFFLMLGDFTGHGLSSGLAILLVTEIFETLCAENPNIELLACDINEKMCRKLPTELFCAALLLRMDLRTGILQVWQGGMPEAYLLDSQGHIVNKVLSNNLPLGVLANQDFSETVNFYNSSDATSIFVYSDGVVEQCDPQELMFGYERLQKTLCTTEPEIRRVDQLIKNLTHHQQDNPQCDDISMLELSFSRVTKALQNNNQALK
ncbi:SpoIIE family protein phosphatase [Methylomonas sp. AM2-LC]|uniref:SpoIIE family protein phosphatase n=1 Tax=Methylomonas sp. AM2-LC TaxID=3153301 RepID=UPI003266819F